MGTLRSLSGACHCGSVHVQFDTATADADLTPRACDCSFCRKHGAAYLFDAGGRVTLETSQATSLHEYRQGSRTARFMLCADCGVLVAVIYDDGDAAYGAVNANCLNDRQHFGPAKVVSPQQWTAEQKASRWRSLWSPVAIKLA